MSPAVGGSVLDVDLGPPDRVFRRRVLIAAAATVVITAGFAGWSALNGGEAPQRPVASGGPAAITLATPSAYHGDAGYPVGFPRTELGAVSAAAAALEASWTLDLAQAEQAAVLYALPEHRESARGDADATVSGWRKTIGLPEEGPLPEGAALRTRTVGVQWRHRAEDQVHVSLLVQVTATRGVREAGPTYSSPFAMSALMIWKPGIRDGTGDWLSAPDPLPATVPAIAAPGTPEFTAAGWRAVAGPTP